MSEGLSGLGALNENNVGGTIQSPGEMLQKHDSDERMLKVYPDNFKSADEYKQYLENWFRATGFVEVLNANEEIAQLTGYNNIFNVKFLSDMSGAIYNIVAAFNIDNAKTFINGLANSGLNNKYKSVLFAFENFSQNDKEIAKRLGVELVSPNEMYEINSAIISPIGGITMVNSFVTRLSKELHTKYKNSAGMGGQVQGNLNSLGSDLGSSFREAADQLKTSITGILGSFGLNKGNANPQNMSVQGQTMNPYPQCQQQVPVQTVVQQPDYSNSQPFGQNPIDFSKNEQAPTNGVNDMTTNPAVGLDTPSENVEEPVNYTGGVRGMVDIKAKNDTVNLEKDTDAINSFMNNPIVNENIPEQSQDENEVFNDMTLDNSESIDPLNGINTNTFGEQ